MLNDTLANILSMITNYGKIGRKNCIVRPASKVVINVLNILKEEGYLNNYRIVEQSRGGLIDISLTGFINKCNVIKPRFSVKKNEFERFEKRFLLAKDFGILIVSTPKGLMTHHKAKELGTGGRLLAYCY